ncbi:hypothetical protein [Propioniciclava sinopodophylli]|uniref:hypothetical protein n=1 Tax=Propioniciclava sinopodophylli TaxID=1837344 RepID=UPI001F4F15F8|nr:hypothetical protein [Propioniciclava sinopodophylli]
MALPPEFGMDLPGAVDAQVAAVHGSDLLGQLDIADRARRGGVVLVGVVGARSDLHACFPQDPADRLDSEFTALHDAAAVSVDVVDDHRDRHLTGRYLILRSSSAAAKKAALVFRISLARRSSRTSRSNSLIRVWSSVVIPGRRPSSTSA